MKVNKSLLAILSIFLVLLIFISSASAADVNKTKVLSVDDSANIIQEDNTVNNINDAGSFDELQKLIDDNNVVNLTKNYTAVDSDKEVYISSDKIINGNGYTIDGAEKTRIFHIEDIGNVVFNNITLKNGKSDSGGAIFVNKADNLTFNHTNFMNNHATSNGGAIFADNSSIEIVESIFDGNHADSNGGAIYSTLTNPKTDISKVKIDKSTFSDNHADDDGGAIFAYAVSISSSNFTENYNENGGGGAVHSVHKSEIVDSIFDGNHADYGGALDHQSNDEKCTIINTIFKNNYAKGTGGAICSLNASIKITYSTFYGNHATYYGGAIHGGDLGISISSSNFTKNYVELYDGGAIFITEISSSDIDITDSIFDSNNAFIDGGAIYATNRLLCTLSVKNTVFTNNKAEGDASRQSYGGAIRSEGSVEVDNSNFTGNHAYDYGGAIYANHLTEIYSSIFKENYVDDNDGGAVYVEGMSVKICDSIFEDNHAYADGGALYHAKTKCTISNTIFKNNNAQGSEIAQCYGGAIRSKGNVNVDNSTFISNYVADYGGAIYADESVNISSSNFTKNKANDNGGGAIYTNAAYIYSSSFTENNAADDDGGAIYGSYSVDVTDSIFDSNKAYIDGGAIYGKTSVTVKNSTFKNNKAEGASSSQCYGGAIRSDIVEADNSTFKDNYAYDYGGAIYANYVYLSSSSFENNKVDDNNGGAICADNKVKVDNCTFLNNHAYDNGGAIYADTITWVYSPSYFIGNYVEDNCGGAIYTNKFETDVKYGVFINNQAKADDDGGAIYINNENHVTFSKCYFENNRCGDEGGAIYLDSMYSHLTLKNNVFVGNKAGDKGNIVYNGGTYDNIEYNWYGKNDFDFENQLVEYHTWPAPDESHKDDNKLQAVMYIDENVAVGTEANLTIYFSNGATPGDLFNIDATFSADNGAVLSNWHTFSGSSYVTGITLTNTGVTHITGKVHNQDLKLDVDPSKGNLRLHTYADPIFVGDNATVVVAGLKNAKGNVSVFLNLTEWTGKINYGTAKIIVTGLKKSTTLGITFSGDENYNPAWASVHITINRYDLNISATADSIMPGDNATVIVTGLENATGNVSVFANLHNWTVEINNGVATVIIPNLKENTTAVVMYPGDYKYNPASTKVDITINRYDLNISASAEPILVDDNATVIVTGLKDATGNITVTIKGNNWTGKINKGTAQIIVTELKDNTTADVIYNGDYKYNPTSTTVDITVYRRDLNISASAEPIIVGDNATVIVTALKDTTGEVLVAIGSNVWTGEINKGIANVVITGLKETSTASIIYTGDQKYNPAATTVNITVYPEHKENLTISASAEPIFVGNNATIIVTGLKNATGNVSVIVGIEKWTGMINNGIAIIIVTGLKDNTVAKVIYDGNKYYNPATTTVNITVFPSMIVYAPNVTKYHSGPERFIVKVLDHKLNPVVNQTVTIKINNVSYNRITDENGTASIALKLNSGTYDVITNVNNITLYSIVNILSTVNGHDVVKIYKNGTQYYATFLDVEGKYLPYGTLVKFNINGVMYNHKVCDNKGRAELNINLPAGNYIITAMNLVTSENAVNNITVISNLVDNKDIVKYYRNETQYTVKVLGPDGRHTGLGAIVTFNINGVTYTRQSNASGIVKLNINLVPGDYIVTAQYGECKVSNKITVLPVLNASDITMKYLDETQFKVNLVDGQGKPYAGQYITFNINGVFYNKLTDSNGQAALNIRLMPGKYIITSSYNGSNIANKITITS